MLMQMEVAVTAPVAGKVAAVRAAIEKGTFTVSAGAIADKLLAAGRAPSDMLAIVSHAATPQQSVIATTLGQAASLADVPTPAIIVLGPVSAHRDTLDWYVGQLRSHVFG